MADNVKYQCSSCGTPAAEGSKFCTMCGSPVIAVQAEEPVVAPQPTKTVVVPQNNGIAKEYDSSYEDIWSKFVKAKKLK